MSNKKYFNNLFSSVCVTLLLLFLLLFYIMIVLFGVINAPEGTNPTVTMIISTVFFGAFSAITVFIIIKWCYEYWWLTENSVCSKKIFRRKAEIEFTKIESVEKKVVPALILGVYKSEAYIVRSKSCRIVILINGKRNIDLDANLIGSPLTRR